MKFEFYNSSIIHEYQCKVAGMKQKENAFTWIPSGMVENNDFSVECGVILVKDSDNTPNYLREEIELNDFLVIYLKDRIVIINPEPRSRRLQCCGFHLDSYFYLNWQQPGNQSHGNMRLVMLSSYYSMKYDTFDMQNRLRHEVMLDSGGYQVITGITDYVDPNELIWHYNREGGYSLVLDFPPSFCDYGHIKIITTLALFQKRNNEIMLRKKKPSTQLLNVVHGSCAKSLRAYIDIVRSDGFVGWAVGGYDIQKKILAIAILYHEYKATWVHVLGIGSATIIPILIYMSQYLKITTDSSSHFQGGITHKYLRTYP